MSSVTGEDQIKTLSGGRGRRLALILLLLLGAMLFFFAAPLFIVFLIGMVPTIVAFVCDRDREKFTAIAVGAGNLAGVVPFLISLAVLGPTLNRAAETITDVFSIAVMYGAAAGGWMVVYVLPPIVAVYMNVTTETRIQKLRKDQRKLVETWGADVMRSDKPKTKPARS